MESIWIEAFELDKKLDSMLEKKAKSTAKVVSSNKENIQKINKKLNENQLQAQKQKQINDNNDNCIKTLNDYFNPINKINVLDIQSEIKEKNTFHKNNIDFGDDEDSEKSQASIMQSVFRHIFK